MSERLFVVGAVGGQVVVMEVPVVYRVFCVHAGSSSYDAPGNEILAYRSTGRALGVYNNMPQYKLLQSVVKWT
eukprot:1883127-Rhodomonas_salina.1